MRTVIFGAGQIHDYGKVGTLIGAPEFIVCADGGIRHALALGFTPNLVVGDFDSAGPALAEEVAARGIPIIQLPTDKDQTDMHVALEQALSRGASEIILAGATGGRLDHTVANLLLLPGAPSHVPITIVDANNVVRLLRPGGRMTLSGVVGETLSLLPLTPEAKGVVLEGVKWPLDNATLRWGETLGVSNRLIEPEAFIALREGYLLVIQAWD